MSRLILRSNDIISGAVPGSVSAYGTQMVWNRIQWDLVLGEELYNKYNKFALVLESVYQTSGYASSTAADGLTLISVAGLPFVNGTYDVANGISRYCPLLHLNWYNNNYNILSYFNQCPIVFHKTNACPLEICVSRLVDNIPAVATGQSVWSFVFSIRPVED